MCRVVGFTISRLALPYRSIVRSVRATCGGSGLTCSHPRHPLLNSRSYYERRRSGEGEISALILLAVATLRVSIMLRGRT